MFRIPFYIDFVNVMVLSMKAALEALTDGSSPTVLFISLLGKTSIFGLVHVFTSLSAGSAQLEKWEK